MNIDVIGELSINYHNGNAYYQVEIIDMKKHEQQKTDTYKSLSNCFSLYKSVHKNEKLQNN